MLFLFRWGEKAANFLEIEVAAKTELDNNPHNQIKNPHYLN